MTELIKVRDNITGEGFEYGYVLKTDEKTETKCNKCGENLNYPFMYCSKKKLFLCRECESKEKVGLIFSKKENKDGHIHFRIIKIEN